MKYGGLTFDTQTVISNSFNFDGGLLAQLKQFKSGPVRIVLSDVIVREIEKHLVERSKAAADAVVLAHRDALRFGLVKGRKSPVADADHVKIAKSRLQLFLSAIGAEVIPTDGIDLEAVVQRYFESAPPFSSRKGKQKEFPDAIALLSLEKWADENHLPLLAVSGDTDWAKYADTSKCIGHTSDLGTALEQFQSDLVDATALAKRLLKKIEHEPTTSISIRFREGLADTVSTRAYDIVAEASDFELKKETADVSLKDFRFRYTNAQPGFRIFGMQADYLALGIAIECDVAIHATFSIVSQVGMGDVDIERNETFMTIYLLSFGPDFRDDAEVVVDVEMIRDPKQIDLGNMDNELREQWETYD